MIHGNKLRKFGREKKVRDALMSSLVRALVLNGKIETTLPKAKSLRPVVEKLVTLGKKGTLASTRLIASRIDSEVASKIVKEVAVKFKDTNGGYTRIIKLAPRKSDAAEMAIIEFV
jgi:large subunit ribosomal protein L17